MLGDRRFGTWCAYDAFGIAAALEVDATVKTRCAVCGGDIELPLFSGRPQEPRAERVWLSAGGPALRSDFCAMTVALCSPEHAARWAADHEYHGTVLTLGQAATLGRIEWLQCQPATAPRSACMLRAVGGRFSLGTYAVTAGIDLGASRPIEPEDVEAQWTNVIGGPLARGRTDLGREREPQPLTRVVGSAWRNHRANVAGVSDVNPRQPKLASRTGSGTLPTIERARHGENAALAELLQRAGLTTSGFDSLREKPLVARDRDGTPLGLVALELYGPVALLRSLAVEEAARGSGLGQRLTRAALSLAAARSVRKVYLLTETADDFFSRFGFRPVDRNEVPQSIRRSIEFTTACPASAIAMELSLREPTRS